MIMIYPVHVVAPNVKMKVLAYEIGHKKFLMILTVKCGSVIVWRPLSAALTDPVYHSFV